MGEGSTAPGGWLPPLPPDRGATPPMAAPERPQPPPAYPQPLAQEQPVFVRPAGGGGPGGLAVAGLVCGITGIGFLVVSAGLWAPLTIPVSTAAWVCAALARRRIRAGLLPPTSAGMAKAGLVLGMVGVALGVVAAIVWIVLISSGVDVEGMLEDLRDELEQQRDSSGQEVRSVAGAAGPVANLRSP